MSRHEKNYVPWSDTWPAFKLLSAVAASSVPWLAAWRSSARYLVRHSVSVWFFSTVAASMVPWLAAWLAFKLLGASAALRLRV